MHLVYSLLLLCSAVAVLVQGGDSSAVSSRAIFIGEDTTDPGTDGEEIYNNPANHATAAASIIAFSANQERFYPKENGLNQQQSQYDGFVQKVSTFPGFYYKYQQQAPLQLTGELEQFKSEVSKIYAPPTGDSGAQATAFVDQVSKLVPNAKSGTWLLTLLSIYKPEESNDITIDLASVEAAVSVNDQGAITLQKQTTQLTQVHFAVNGRFLEAYASNLASLFPTVTIDKLNDQLTTPSDESLESWFFGSEHDCGAKSSSQTHWPRRQKLYSF